MWGLCSDEKSMPNSCTPTHEPDIPKPHSKEFHNLHPSQQVMHHGLADDVNNVIGLPFGARSLLRWWSTVPSLS
jgi:hypothetical protein